MWSLLPLDAIKRGLAANPWIKWALVVLVGLYAVEFIGSRAVDLVVKLETAKATIAQKNAEASAKAGPGVDISSSPAFAHAPAPRPSVTATRTVATSTLPAATSWHLSDDDPNFWFGGIVTLLFVGVLTTFINVRWPAFLLVGASWGSISAIVAGEKWIVGKADEIPMILIINLGLAFLLLGYARWGERREQRRREKLEAEFLTLSERVSMSQND